MFSATRLVAAVAVVALGTGTLFLAASPRPSPVPTLSPSPSPTAWAPPTGWVTEEVEPGIHKLLDDGAEHGGRLRYGGELDIAVGSDGSVWVADASKGSNRELYRLGAPGTADASGLDAHWPDLTVGPAGTVLGVGPGSAGVRGRGPVLLTLTDGEWSEDMAPDGIVVDGVDVASDGAIVVNGYQPGASDRCGDAHGADSGPPVVWETAEEGPRLLPGLPDEVISSGDGGSLAVAPDGTIWLGIDFFNSCPAYGGLFRFDGRIWEVVPEVLHGEGVNVGQPAIGSDGTIWVYATGERSGLIAEGAPELSGHGRTLSRLADGSWTTFDESDRVPLLYGSQTYGAAMDVAPDGTLWLAFVGDGNVAFDINRDAGVLDGPDDTGPCPGVLSFDGTAWRTHLGGTCVSDLAVAEDGSVWVSVEPAGSERAGVYRIDPGIGAGEAP